MQAFQMSMVERAAFNAAWAHRKQLVDQGYTIGRDAPRDRPRDRWVIRLLARGALPSHLIEIAERYALALETTEQRTSSAIAERVSGGRRDPHAAKADALDARRVVRSARAHLAEHIRGEWLAVFDLAFATPHLSMAEIRRRTGKNYDGVVRALTASLTRLWAYWAQNP